MNSTVKKLISEDSDFVEPQTLQDYGPVISSAKDLADYLVELGFIQENITQIDSNQLFICVAYSTVKIEPKHTEYTDLKSHKIGVHKEYINVLITELSNNVTEISVHVYIHLPYRNENTHSLYECFYKKIPNTQLQNFAFYMEKALTYFENAQKYIDSGKGISAMTDDIRDIFKPLMDTKIKNQTS